MTGGMGASVGGVQQWRSEGVAILSARGRQIRTMTRVIIDVFDLCDAAGVMCAGEVVLLLNIGVGDGG